jgi:hypothetical protein
MPTSLDSLPRNAVLGVATRWNLVPHSCLHLVCLQAAVPGLTVTSGRRSAAHNAEVGGAEHSHHLEGRAVDLTGSRHTLNSALECVREQRVTAGCTGPVEAFIEFPGTPHEHLHVAW